MGNFELQVKKVAYSYIVGVWGAVGGVRVKKLTIVLKVEKLLSN